MTALLVAWLIPLPPVLLIGFAFGRLHRKPPSHRHIWAPWKPRTVGQISKGESVKVPAQERECLDCGFREWHELLLQ